MAVRAHNSCQILALAGLLLLDCGQHRLTVTGEGFPPPRGGPCTHGERSFSISG